MDVLLGGYEITDIDWLGPESIAVSFRADSPLLVGRYWQLYANRKLVQVSKTPDERRLIGYVPAGRRAAPIALASIAAGERTQDIGDLLARAPWNRYRLSWARPSNPSSDLRGWDVCLCRQPGLSFDPTNVVGFVEFKPEAANYAFDLPVFDEGTGDWSVGLVPHDRTVPAGNAGTASELVIPATVYPLDLTMREDGNRFDVAVSGGVLTASFGYGVLE